MAPVAPAARVRQRGEVRSGAGETRVVLKVQLLDSLAGGAEGVRGGNGPGQAVALDAAVQVACESKY